MKDSLRARLKRLRVWTCLLSKREFYIYTEYCDKKRKMSDINKELKISVGRVWQILNRIEKKIKGQKPGKYNVENIKSWFQQDIYKYIDKERLHHFSILYGIKDVLEQLIEETKKPTN
jgi:hypothetical protein